MSDDLVKRVRALLEGVTPGPWRYDRTNGSPTTGEHMIAGGLPGYLAEVRDCGSGNVSGNARFIAASRQLVPAMADRIKALEAQLADLRLELLFALGEAGANLDRAVKAEAALAAAEDDAMFEAKEMMERYADAICEDGGP